MDYRGIIHPRHAGLLSMLPVNTGQPHCFKEQCKYTEKLAMCLTDYFSALAAPIAAGLVLIISHTILHHIAMQGTAFMA